MANIDKPPCNEPNSVMLWRSFSFEVEKHLREYAVPQYGDAGDDEITEYSVAECVAQCRKYAARHGKNAREGQDKLDLIKIAVYAMRAADKLRNNQDK